MSQNIVGGYEISTLMSRSENNPYRRYHRCSYVASKKVMLTLIDLIVQ